MLNIILETLLKFTKEKIMNFKRFLKLAVLCMSLLIIFACESVDEPAQESQVNNEAVTTEESVD